MTRDDWEQIGCALAIGLVGLVLLAAWFRW